MEWLKERILLLKEKLRDNKKKKIEAILKNKNKKQKSNF